MRSTWPSHARPGAPVWAILHSASTVFSAESFAAGVETHTLDEIPVRVFSPEKTLSDCFKYRNRIGMEVVLEAMRTYRQRRKPRFQQVLEYAKVCRVERLIRPYLETLA